MMYKKMFTLIAGFFLITTLVFCEDTISTDLNVSVRAHTHEKIKIKLILVGKKSSRMLKIAETIKNDLEFSGQFDVVMEYQKKRADRKADIQSYFLPDCTLGLFLTQEKRNKSIGWRLYDLQYASMVQGAQCKIKGKDSRSWAHKISDSIWPHLANEPGFFSTKITYCKEKKREGKKSYKHVYIADYDGSNEQLLVSTPTINVAPRWNNDPEHPLIFYSEHTNENVRLMLADMKGRRKIVSNFDGLNVLSAFSLDGKKFAYCASRGDGYCQIYYYVDRTLKRITDKGNNISPTFADNGKTIYFCSDAKTGRPQIYKYEVASGAMERISKGGFIVSTAFNEKKNLLAYAKMVKRLMQIFVYDPKTGTHRQLTSGPGNKEECSWSPCGNYLLFSVENKIGSGLAVFNLLTGEQKIIQNMAQNCYYPSWSPFYNEFPCLRGPN